MRYYFSIAINLDEILMSSDFEKKIIGKLNHCYQNTDSKFKVIFWHENLKESEIKKFIKRNDEYLFKWGTDFTKKINNAWFIINKPETNKGTYRYYYSGTIANGIDEYMTIISHIKNRGNNYDKGRSR